ncbi:MAG TPA: hypothetical protein VNK44_07650 [Candidatus Nitrosotenuis sp.]|nr:hypothetical protein [Candidatus Nitrosotenuis sp.]
MQEARISLKTMPIKAEEIIFDHPHAPFNKDSITKEIQRQKQKFMLYLETKEVSFRVPDIMVGSTGITNSWYKALDCFGVQQYEATILFASIAVEAVLNHDKRLYNYKMRSPNKWINLNQNNLKIASKNGIEISALLDRDCKGSEFITRRNKIAHGDISGYVSYLYNEKPNRALLEKIMVTRKHALNQLNRSFRFITTWAETNPTIILEGIEQIRSATR